MKFRNWTLHCNTISFEDTVNYRYHWQPIQLINDTNKKTVPLITDIIYIDTTKLPINDIIITSLTQSHSSSGVTQLTMHFR